MSFCGYCSHLRVLTLEKSQNHESHESHESDESDESDVSIAVSSISTTSEILTTLATIFKMSANSVADGGFASVYTFPQTLDALRSHGVVLGIFSTACSPSARDQIQNAIHNHWFEPATVAALKELNAEFKTEGAEGPEGAEGVVVDGAFKLWLTEFTKNLLGKSAHIHARRFKDYMLPYSVIDKIVTDSKTQDDEVWGSIVKVLFSNIEEIHFHTFVVILCSYWRTKRGSANEKSNVTAGMVIKKLNEIGLKTILKEELTGASLLPVNCSPELRQILDVIGEHWYKKQLVQNLPHNIGKEAMQKCVQYVRNFAANPCEDYLDEQTMVAEYLMERLTRPAALKNALRFEDCVCSIGVLTTLANQGAFRDLGPAVKALFAPLTNINLHTLVVIMNACSTFWRVTEEIILSQVAVLSRAGIAVKRVDLVNGSSPLKLQPATGQKRHAQEPNVSEPFAPPPQKLPTVWHRLKKAFPTSDAQCDAQRSVDDPETERVLISFFDDHGPAVEQILDELHDPDGYENGSEN